jgi:hypothetical protein
MNFTIGCDPEFFLSKGGQWVSAIPLVDGTKEEPAPLERGGGIQRDNVAVEINTLPAKNKVEFVQRMAETIQDMRKYLPNDVEINVVPSATFPEEELDHPEAKMFGCDPDYNAWTMEMNNPPADAGDNQFRSCGGHVLFSFDGDSAEKGMLIRLCDVTLGIPATMIDDSDEALARRALYGNPGCYRETDFGVEYRTLSNFWCKSPMLVELIYHLVEDTLEIMKDDPMGLVMAIGPDEIQRIIKTGDKGAAIDVLNQYLHQHLSPDTLVLLANCIGAEHDFKEWENV